MGTENGLPVVPGDLETDGEEDDEVSFRNFQEVHKADFTNLLTFDSLAKLLVFLLHQSGVATLLLVLVDVVRNQLHQRQVDKN